MNRFYCVDLIFGCLVLFTWSWAQAQVDSEPCITPDHLSGHCISIYDCDQYLEKLKNKPTPSDIEFIRRARCSFRGKTPLVCCPKAQTPPAFEPTLNLPIRTGPKDVSNYTRLRVLLPEKCGVYIQEKITGGKSASLFEFPWMALLGYETRSGFDYRCGGSLINARYVLTAAHCIKKTEDLKLVEVRLGEFDQDREIDCQVGKACSDPVQDFLVEEAIAHKNYGRKNQQNDIGLVRLNRSAMFTPSVSPICLPIGKELQERNLDKENLIATGWGVTESGSSSSILLKVELPVVPNRNCADRYQNLVKITEKQICAGGVDERDSCFGDSGGPLQQLRPIGHDISYVQFGIVSFGPSGPCGLQNIPGVYTRVGYFMDWILDNMHL